MDARTTQAALVENGDWELTRLGCFRCEMMGHVLEVHNLSQPNYCPTHTWFKWIDGHFRGMAFALSDAEHELEDEAKALVSAWKRKQAWNGVERRRGSRESSSEPGQDPLTPGTSK
jgi:hypothetical protein